MKGLRTLCLGYRVIAPAEYKAWSMKYQEAQKEIVDRDIKLDEISELIEKDMVLMGATAIEDKLQEGVPECIATLSKAGIKIWVLTVSKTHSGR